MVFWRSRKSTWTHDDKLAELKRTFPQEKPETLEQALGGARGDFAETIRILNSTHHTQDIIYERPTPKKLQRSPPSHSSDSSAHFRPWSTSMIPSQSYAHPSPANWNGHPSSPSPPQYQQSSPPYHPGPAPFPQNPNYFPPQQQVPLPMAPRFEPLTEIMQQTLDLCHVDPMPPPPPNTIWTPHQSDQELWGAVPMYELPPPDLMDYDMSILVPLRTIPRWDRTAERRHWDQVRRNRYAAIRVERGDREDCILM